MPYHHLDDVKPDLITPEYSSAFGPNVCGKKIEVGRFLYPKGTQAKFHSHPNEQMQVVLRGRARFSIGGEERVVGPGDLVHVAPPNVKHGILEVMEDLEVINCKEVVPGFSVKHARWEDEAARKRWEAGS
ncbi:MAG: cupin domain-containing protein [Candidatus Tectomicrobia bacterium]|uniref:Cupin domain-containing protein n=1 Tax=Tectimicrobiota bacterium TaxID=2528274 RepID=A0A932I007_UNCTE|nr:cupin domain-containing protein [Candidatus Tectomicrobia bacterium]